MPILPISTPLAPAFIAGARTAPSTRACSAADWGDPVLVETMRSVVPAPNPIAFPHRKAWEFAMGALALARGGVLKRDARGLSTGAGHEAILYWLTHHVGHLTATDIYGAGDFAGGESSFLMVSDPDLFAPYEYDGARLGVQDMNALALEFPDSTFDFTISFGSIEHFGGVGAAVAAVAEMARVTRPGGVVFFTTEMSIDGGPPAHIPALELFTPDSMRALVGKSRGLEWLDGEAIAVPSTEPIIDLLREVELVEAGIQNFPHRALGVQDLATGYRHFTSVAIALRRVKES